MYVYYRPPLMVKATEPFLVEFLCRNSLVTRQLDDKKNLKASQEMNIEETEIFLNDVIRLVKLSDLQKHSKGAVQDQTRLGMLPMFKMIVKETEKFSCLFGLADLICEKEEANSYCTDQVSL